jgi:predicted Zn-dependent peptidase
MLNEIEKIRNEPVPEEDLEFARTARVNAFPALFSGGRGRSAIFGTLGNFANLEFNGRPMDHYDTYVARYEAVTVDDIQRVAREYLRPENMIIMISGNIDESRAGADDMLLNQAAREVRRRNRAHSGVEVAIQVAQEVANVGKT